MKFKTTEKNQKDQNIKLSQSSDTGGPFEE